MKINDLTKEQKVELLKLLVDDLDIIITACYGATDYIDSSCINIWEGEDSWDFKKGMVVISTDIMTG